jgi:hypothetical protein
MTTVSYGQRTTMNKSMTGKKLNVRNDCEFGIKHNTNWTAYKQERSAWQNLEAQIGEKNRQGERVDERLLNRRPIYGLIFHRKLPTTGRTRIQRQK